jgi:putative addiction module killer protein
VIVLRRHVTPEGKDVFGEWLAKLKDARAQAKIVIRLDRVVAGNFADCKPLREALYELRIDWDRAAACTRRCRARPACCFSGGDKRKQSSDIENALACLGDDKEKDQNDMKRKTSISRDEAVVRELRDNPTFCGRVPESRARGRERTSRPADSLCAGWCRLEASPRSRRLPELSARAFIELSRSAGIPAYPRLPL